MKTLEVADLQGAGIARAGVEFLQIEPAVRRNPRPPAFVVGSVTDKLLHDLIGPSNLHAAGIFSCSDATLAAPFFVMRGNTAFVCPEANIHKAYLDKEWIEHRGLTAISRLREVSGTCAMVFGPGHKMFGHWMADLLPKLYLLHKAGLEEGQLFYALPSDIPAFARQLIRMIGIADSRILEFDATTEALRCERLLIPTTMHNGFIFAAAFKDAVGWLRQRIEALVGPLAGRSPLKNVLVSRGHAYGLNRVLLNRSEIESMAVDAGFQIIYPEELSLIDQFSIFSNADQIVGEYGAALHTAMFAEAGSVVCALRGNSYHPGFLQSGIGEACGHRVGYVIGQNANERWDFTVGREDFAAALQTAFRTESAAQPGRRVRAEPAVGCVGQGSSATGQTTEAGGMPLLMSERSRDARILTAITFHFDISHLRFLGEVLRSLSEFSVAGMHIIVVTNSVIEQEIMLIRRLADEVMPNPEMVSIRSYGNLDHPFDLTWCHKNIIDEEFSQSATDSSRYSHFIYLEHDMRITFQNFCYFVEFREMLRDLNLIPAFLRIEYNHQLCGFVNTDNDAPVDVAGVPRLDFGETVLVNMPNPYNACFILDRELAAEYVRSRSFDREGSAAVVGWGVRERAAMGLCFENVPAPFQRRYVVPVSKRTGRAEDFTWISHLPNNYADNPNTGFGKVRMDSLFVNVSGS